MPVPTSITDLSTTPGSNFPQSTDSCGSTLHELPRNVSAIIKKQFVAGSDVAAANGILTLPSDYSSVKITGAGATITGFADCFNGRVIVVRFDGINTLTHSASFDMPTGASITTASGDVATFINVSAGVWQCISYDKASLRYSLASVFPSGTKLMFAQAAAPTGWTQVVDDSANNRMLRVINTGGGGVGGSHSPILNNVVPAHTHGFTTSTESAYHSHSDSGHVHGSATGSGFWDYTPAVGPNSLGGPVGATPSSTTATGYANIGIQSALHTHFGTTDNGSSSTNWTPRYIDMILCSKN